MKAADQQADVAVDGLQHGRPHCSESGIAINHNENFHVVTVAWDPMLVEQLWNAVSARSSDNFSHIMHPSYALNDWPYGAPQPGVYFFREELRQPMPDADLEFLTALERDDVPTIHNMIMGDRIVSKIGYSDALRYATFLARRMLDLFDQIKPTVIIGGFDAIHGGLALAVARHMNIPWFALNFSVIPPGLACFCNGLTPAARVQIGPPQRFTDLRAFAEESLQKFETKSIQAPAYIEPSPPSLARKIAKLPAQMSAVARRVRRAQAREFLQFTEGRDGHSVLVGLRKLHHATRARNAISKIPTLVAPPTVAYVLFGLHMQPESSIDVWAPFFSNQMWVVELLARSIPPSHKLLVKIHKSDVAKYSSQQLERMRAFPGVELIRPFADTRAFIEKAGLVISIQGTMGLEAALLGRPVIMLGDSPVVVFPGASRVGEIADLPALIRQKLADRAPSRDEIIEAYASYLAPFLRASHNDWTVRRREEEINGYVKLFSRLKRHLADSSGLTA